MPQTPLETAKENLARLFKSDASKIEALFSGQPVVLKRDLSDDEADKYLRALHGAGANARKEAEGVTGFSLVETDDHPSEATLAARAAGEATSNERMTCPKCGHEQASAIECSACGIVIEKYLARQAELAANPVAAAPVAAAAAAAASASPYAPPQAQVGEQLPEYGDL
jgi:ribosomal protein L7/L12